MKKILLACSLGILLACSSTRVTNSWKSAQTTPAHYKKILVVGLYGENHLAERARMEEHLVGDLKALGYDARSSLQDYGPRAFDGKQEQTVVNELKNSSIDAVITIVLLDKQKEQRYVPGEVYYSPYFIYQRNFWHYYNTMYGRIYTPGYYTTTTRYFWESNLYDLASRELIYSVQTESFDPASVETLAHEYGKAIVKDIVKMQVLHKQEWVAR